jgi:DNA polymerase alpha subunit A
VAGRLLCDTYLAARDLVHEVDYTLSTLARSLLKQERAELSPTDVPGAPLASWLSGWLAPHPLHAA